MVERGQRVSAQRFFPDTDVNAVVLVGGKSRRMGRPKQTLIRGGVTLAEIAVAAVQGSVHRVVLAGHGPVPESLGGLELLADIPGPSGPLGGILAAMRHSPEATWIVSACDMPRVRREDSEDPESGRSFPEPPRIGWNRCWRSMNHRCTTSCNGGPRWAGSDFRNWRG
jgi:hypothetical protein